MAGWALTKLVTKVGTLGEEDKAALRAFHAKTGAAGLKEFWTEYAEMLNECVADLKNQMDKAGYQPPDPLILSGEYRDQLDAQLASPTGPNANAGLSNVHHTGAADINAKAEQTAKRDADPVGAIVSTGVHAVVRGGQEMAYDPLVQAFTYGAGYLIGGGIGIADNAVTEYEEVHGKREAATKDYETIAQANLAAENLLALSAKVFEKFDETCRKFEATIGRAPGKVPETRQVPGNSEEIRDKLKHSDTPQKDRAKGLSTTTEGVIAADQMIRENNQVPLDEMAIDNTGGLVSKPEGTKSTVEDMGDRALNYDPAAIATDPGNTAAGETTIEAVAKEGFGMVPTGTIINAGITIGVTLYKGYRAYKDGIKEAAKQNAQAGTVTLAFDDAMKSLINTKDDCERIQSALPARRTVTPTLAVQQMAHTVNDAVTVVHHQPPPMPAALVGQAMTHTGDDAVTVVPYADQPTAIPGEQQPQPQPQQPQQEGPNL
jgi:hypothetical protein